MEFARRIAVSYNYYRNRMSFSSPTKRPPVISYLGFPLLIVGILVLVVVFSRQLWAVFSTPEAVREWISQWGLIAPGIFVAAQIIQVLVFIIPGETVQIAGGYLFGYWLGLALTTSGIAIGSAANFYLARFLGTPFVAHYFKERQLKKFGRIANSPKAQVGFFLLFVIPGIPKDILCYVAGLSPMRFLYFLAVSMLGRLPGIIGSTLMGSAAAEKQWTLSITIFAVAFVLFIIGLLYKERIQRWIERYIHRH